MRKVENGITTLYEYNELNQLIKEEITGGDEISYDYDTEGNLIIVAERI